MVIRSWYGTMRPGAADAAVPEATRALLDSSDERARHVHVVISADPEVSE